MNHPYLSGPIEQETTRRRCRMALRKRAIETRRRWFDSPQATPLLVALLLVVVGCCIAIYSYQPETRYVLPETHEVTVERTVFSL